MRCPELEIGVPGQIMPPASKAVDLARKNEADGFDALWWPCHLMGWHPDSIWTPDMSPLAEFQTSSHVYFDPFIMMGAVGAQTERVRLGSVVTDLVRRNPAMVANMALTLDHLTEGRSIIGLGSGEAMNITPYGMDFSKPVGKLAEGIEVIRRLWEADGAIDFEGKHHVLTDAVLGLSPFGSEPPPIWTAAHGPRMLDITGRLADGWLPTKLEPAIYEQSLDRIRTAASGSGRDPDAITPGILAYVLAAPDQESLARMQNAPLVRAMMVMLPDQIFEKLGVVPPEGFHELIPASVPRDKAEAIIAGIPPKVVDYYCFCGTPEQIADEVASYYDVGLRHLIMWNITAFGDPELARWSFDAMKQVKEILRG